MIRHCDDYIDDPAQPECLRRFLDYNRLPAALKYPTHSASLDKVIEEHHDRPIWRDPVPVLFARHEGRLVRVTMASRFGDVGISEDLDAERGYDKRVAVEELTDLSDVAPEAKATVMIGGISIPMRRMGVREMAKRIEQTTELTTELEVTFREMSPFVSTLACLREAGPNRKQRRAAAARARRA